MKIFFKNSSKNDYIKVSTQESGIKISITNDLDNATDFSNFKSSEINNLKNKFEKTLKIDLTMEFINN